MYGSENALNNWFLDDDLLPLYQDMLKCRLIAAEDRDNEVTKLNLKKARQKIRLSHRLAIENKKLEITDTFDNLIKFYLKTWRIVRSKRKNSKADLKTGEINFTEFSRNFFNFEPGSNEFSRFHTLVESTVDQRLGDFQGIETFDRIVNIEEVRCAIGKLKVNKLNGSDGLKSENSSSMLLTPLFLLFSV